MMKGGNSGNFSNPCLTMHQPWASLLVYGIKRIEGRSWTAPIRGRLWIHAASKVPEESTIKAMENFYREIYALDGITDLKFPEHYPVSRLLGCVEVVGCVRGDELAHWDEVSEGVRLEAQTDFCWLCEQPQKLVVPFEMRGYQRVYNLEKKIFEAAVRGLTRVEVPLTVKFKLPNPGNPFSLKPGSISSCASETNRSEVEKSSKLDAAVAGARAAATQFSRKNQDPQPSIDYNNTPDFGRVRSRIEYSERDNVQSSYIRRRTEELSSTNTKEQTGGSQYAERNPNRSRAFIGAYPEQSTGSAATQFSRRDQNPQPYVHYNTYDFKRERVQTSNFRRFTDVVSSTNTKEQTGFSQYEERSSSQSRPYSSEYPEQYAGAPKIFAAAVRRLRPT